MYKDEISIEDEYLIKSLIVIDQAESVLSYDMENKDFLIKFKQLLSNLKKINDFYIEIGGIIGYHYHFLKLLDEKDKKIKNIEYFYPKAINIENLDFDVESLVDIGLENLSKIALILPIGGAAERLGLVNPKTKIPIPMAKLNFLGKTLLENAIEDIKSLEYLYYQTFKKQIVTPIVLMTSEYNNNHEQIVKLLEEKNWFERDKNNYFFIKQICSPLITKDGNWALKSPLTLALKPSGHGVLWQLMKKQKAFEFLKSQNRTKALIRQINNPIANTDFTLLAFLGTGIKFDKKFGFASCARKVKSAEGINILKEIKQGSKFVYNYSNIEYTEFKKYNIKDVPINDNSDISKYPSNTNILFADLLEIEKTIIKNPFPGLIINLKTKVYAKDKDNKIVQVNAGRLESMMQNISDSITDQFDEKIKDEEKLQLKTFITYSKRNKTISATKKSYKFGSDIIETPEGCYFDVLSNYYDVLTNFSKMSLPDMPSKENYILQGPSFITYLNPSIGPLYKDIAKKIIGGRLQKQSELFLDLSNVNLENVDINGSLIIKAITYKNKKFLNHNCHLSNVKINNEGIDYSSDNIFYQNNIKHKGFLKIILNENSTFYAKNIIFNESKEIIVPANCKMYAFQDNNKVLYKTENK
ncbi:MAG: UTP--glucose-1-phosphate uridylyltransferase [Parachlamydiales bacterium]|nr:UTP--glucose-1-phosphate uridylyltransferase [Parachlamydiales bacterium]